MGINSALPVAVGWQRVRRGDQRDVTFARATLDTHNFFGPE